MSISDAVLAGQLAKARPAFKGLTNVTISAAGAGNVPWNMTRDRSLILGCGPSKTGVYGSYDDGATWGRIVDSSAGNNSGSAPFEGVWPLADGELLLSVYPANGRGELWKSNGFSSWDGSTAVAFNRVLVASSANNYFRGHWCVDHRGTIVVASEYGKQSGTGLARYAYLSVDGGGTFYPILDLAQFQASTDETLNPPAGVNGQHCHAIAIDPFNDRIWLTHGDTQSRLVFSDDLGETWQVAQFSPGGGYFQSTTILPTPNGVLLGTDGQPYGIHRVRLGTDRGKAFTQPWRYRLSLGSPTAGTFTLTYGAQTTAAIAWNATAAAVQSALEALTSIGAGNVSVKGPASGPYAIAFIGTLAAAQPGAMTGTSSLTAGGVNLALQGPHHAIVPMEYVFGYQNLVSGRSYLAYSFYRHRGLEGAPALMCLLNVSGSGNWPSKVVATVDGNAFYEVWSDPANLTNLGLQRVIGPTKSGKVLGYYAASSGNPSIFKADAPAFPETPMAPN